MKDMAVYSESIDVAGRLDALGIDEATLRQSVTEGAGFVLNCTAHDPTYLPGILGSGKIVRALRDHLIPRGWSYENPRNYALTTHPSGTFTIAVAGGDANTGCEATPTTRAEKGAATRDAIDGNLQLQLANVDPRFPRIVMPATAQTWLLLYYVDNRLGEIRMELSQPRGMDSEGFVTSWHERIMLHSESFGMPPESEKWPRDDEGGDAIDVPVERRAQQT